MPEPATIATAVFSGLNAILKIAQQSAHFSEVTNEVRQLQINVQLADDSINTAHRLIRFKGHYLDNDLLNDVDRSIAHTTKILGSLRDSFESCRKDIETKGTVSFKNRASWVIFKNQEFLSKLATLTNAMNALNRDINRMENSKVPENNCLPPGYVDVIGADDDPTVGSVHSFARSPIARRRLQSPRSHRMLPNMAAFEGDSVSVRPDNLLGLQSTPSTSSFTSSVTAAESSVSTFCFSGPLHASELPSESSRTNNNLTHSVSAPIVPYLLPGGLSLGFEREDYESTKAEDDCEGGKWQNEAGDKMDGPIARPLPVPLRPRGPRRRSNFI